MVPFLITIDLEITGQVDQFSMVKMKWYKEHTKLSVKIVKFTLTVLLIGSYTVGTSVHSFTPNYTFNITDSRSIYDGQCFESHASRNLTRLPNNIY
jgi:hypothetical protein